MFRIWKELDHYENMSIEVIENMMNLNMLAVVKMVNSVLPYMHKKAILLILLHVVVICQSLI